MGSVFLVWILSRDGGFVTSLEAKIFGSFAPLFEANGETVHTNERSKRRRFQFKNGPFFSLKKSLSVGSLTVTVRKNTERCRRENETRYFRRYARQFEPGFKTNGRAVIENQMSKVALVFAFFQGPFLK